MSDTRKLERQVLQLQQQVAELTRRTATMPARYAIGGKGGSGDLRLVRLQQTGGSAGTRTTPCTYTYTVLDYATNAEIATEVAMTGNGQRVLNAAMTAGTIGIGKPDG